MGSSSRTAYLLAVTEWTEVTVGGERRPGGPCAFLALWGLVAGFVVVVVHSSKNSGGGCSHVESGQDISSSRETFEVAAWVARCKDDVVSDKYELCNGG